MNEKSFEERLLENAEKYLNEKEYSLSDEQKFKAKEKIVNNFKALRDVENALFTREHGLTSCVGGATNLYLCNSSGNCINSHTIGENQTKFIGGDNQESKVMSLVKGVTSYFENDTTHCLLPVATKRASSFYGFCSDCEILFSQNLIDDFEKINIDNFCLFFYRHIGRDIRMTLSSVKKHQEYISNFTGDIEYPHIEGFWKWLTNEEGDTLLEAVNKEIKKLSLIVHDIQKDFVNFFASHQNKISIENNGCVTQYKNYKMYEIKPNIDGFCIGSMMFPVARKLYNNIDNEYFIQYMFVIFGVVEGKQVVKIFAHEKVWQMYSKCNYSNWQTENLKFIHFLIGALNHQRPNMYFNKIYKEKITNCLNYIKNNEIFYEKNKFLLDVKKIHLNDIFKIIEAK